MKRIHILTLKICFLVAIIGLSSSCKRFFEEPDSTTFDEDRVFERIEDARKLVYQMYSTFPRMISVGWDERLNGGAPEVLTDGASAFTVQISYGTHKFNKGAINAKNVAVTGGEYIYRWTDVRQAYTLIERINEVPNASSEEKGRIIAESKTMIAFRYFEMFKRFGGVPIVRNRLNDPSEYKITRSTLQETYDFIIGLLNEAIASPDFPARVPELEFGRMTKAYAYALKAKVMLYAASPLFNTGSPYMSFGANNNLICFGSTDKERWKSAMTAAKEAIVYCEANGYKVVDDQVDAVTNYVVASEKTPQQGNTEIILGMQLRNTLTGPNMWLPRGVPFSGYAANSPTHNQVERYRKNDGTFIDWSKGITTPANDPTFPYKDLEPRFQATIGYNGMLWYPGVRLELYDGTAGGTNGKNGSIVTGSEFNYAIHKYVHGYESFMTNKPAWWMCLPHMRLSEMYFILAEATNEYEGANTDVANALNKVLNRSGMSVPQITDQEEMRKFIKRERAIEFYYEDHRYFDLKRWLNGEEVGNSVYNIVVLKNSAGVYTYNKAVQENRVWRNYYYLFPFPQTEIDKNFGLIQNPGW